MKNKDTSAPIVLTSPVRKVVTVAVKGAVVVVVDAIPVDKKVILQGNVQRGEKKVVIKMTVSVTPVGRLAICPNIALTKDTNSETREAVMSLAMSMSI